MTGTSNLFSYVELLFVYGTLLTDFKHPEGEKLRATARLIGAGSVSGKLYDIGEYPGLVIGKEEGIAVLGEVYDLTGCTDHWVNLDAYEGIEDSDTPEYTREKVLVTTTTATLTCWTYIYQGSVQELKLIKGGDYLRYLKEC